MEFSPLMFDVKDLTELFNRQIYQQTLRCDKPSSQTTLHSFMSDMPPSRTSSCHLLREKQLMDAIEKVQSKLNETAIKLSESKAAKDSLRERLLALQGKVSKYMWMGDHPSVKEVEDMWRLTRAAKETKARKQRIRELEERTRSLKDGFERAEEIISMAETQGDTSEESSNTSNDEAASLRSSTEASPENILTKSNIVNVEGGPVSELPTPFEFKDIASESKIVKDQEGSVSELPNAFEFKDVPETQATGASMTEAASPEISDTLQCCTSSQISSWLEEVNVSYPASLHEEVSETKSNVGADSSGLFQHPTGSQVDSSELTLSSLAAALQEGNLTSTHSIDMRDLSASGAASISGFDDVSRSLQSVIIKEDELIKMPSQFEFEELEVPGARLSVMLPSEKSDFLKFSTSSQIGSVSEDTDPFLPSSTEEDLEVQSGAASFSDVKSCEKIDSVEFHVSQTSGSEETIYTVTRDSQDENEGAAVDPDKSADEVLSVFEHEDSQESADDSANEPPSSFEFQESENEGTPKTPDMYEEVVYCSPLESERKPKKTTPLELQLYEEKMKAFTLAQQARERLMFAMMMKGMAQLPPSVHVSSRVEAIPEDRLAFIQERIKEVERDLKTVDRRKREAQRERRNLIERVSELEDALIETERRKVVNRLIKHTIPSAADIEALERIAEKRVQRQEREANLRELEKKTRRLDKAYQQAASVIENSNWFKANHEAEEKRKHLQFAKERAKFSFSEESPTSQVPHYSDTSQVEWHPEVGPNRDQPYDFSELTEAEKEALKEMSLLEYRRFWFDRYHQKEKTDDFLFLEHAERLSEQIGTSALRRQSDLMRLEAEEEKGTISSHDMTRLNNIREEMLTIIDFDYDSELGPDEKESEEDLAAVVCILSSKNKTSPDDELPHSSNAK